MVVAGSEQVAEDEIEELVGTNSEGVVVVGARICVVVVVTPALRLPMHVKLLVSLQLVKLLVKGVKGTFR